MSPGGDEVYLLSPLWMAESLPIKPLTLTFGKRKSWLFPYLNFRNKRKGDVQRRCWTNLIVTLSLFWQVWVEGGTSTDESAVIP